MRIVIIGGRGLLGTALSVEAVKHGHQVLILSRQNSGVEKSDQIEFRQWDGKDAKALAELISSYDSIVNLAGESIGKSRWTMQRKEQLFTSRVEPTTAIVNAIKSSVTRPKVIIQASAVGIYGTGDGEVSETSNLGDDYLAHLAIEWEKSSKEVEALGVRRVLIRSGIVLDRNKGVLRQLILPFKLLVGGKIGSGKQWYSWIHINDEIEAILFLLEHEQSSGIYNLSSPNPVTNSEIGQALAKVMGKPFWFPIPAFAMRLLLGEMSTLVLDGQKVMPKRLEAAGFKFKYPKINQALEDLLQEK
jgi:uncharacterized protein (TIGR01777 family)